MAAYSDMPKTPHENRSFEAISRRLIATREAIGLKQSEFAKRAGIPINTYNQYEKAVSQPRLDYAYALCDTYDITLDWIYNGDPSGLPYRLAKDLFKETA
jgi:transcriptional regulator with XRE-family HTH domain